MKQETFELIRAGQIKKGDVLTVAQIAGISASKRTSELIPLCHPLFLSKVDVNLALDESLPGIIITATAKVNGKTGVEMEALTAVSVAALTVYGMAKASVAVQRPAADIASGGHSARAVSLRSRSRVCSQGADANAGASVDRA